MSAALFDALMGESSLPEAVMVDGRRYPIYTDFRFWMRVESTLFDSGVSDEQKTVFFLSAFTPAILEGVISPVEGYPFPGEAGIAALQEFFACGWASDAEKGRRADNTPRKRERPYDFKHDAGLLYAAFRDAYGLDLRTEKYMHWWVFRALFDGLPEGTAICSIMSERATPLPKKATAEQKKRKEKAALPERIRWFEAGNRKMENLDAWAARIRGRKASRG